MGRWRVAALILAVVAFVLAGIADRFSFQVARPALFWLGIVCFLAAAWGGAGG
jgi:hypothetical protein